MYTVTKYISHFHITRRYYSDEAIKLKKSIFLPVTKFKSWLNSEQSIQRDNHIFKVKHAYLIIKLYYIITNIIYMFK